MGSYRRKITKRRIVLSIVLMGIFALLICMSLFLEGKAYYCFATNTPLGMLLYFASAFRYLEEINAAIILDISYLVILFGMICSVVISLRKQKAIKLVYAVCACDIVVCLLLFNALGIVGDIAIITVAIFSTKSM